MLHAMLVIRVSSVCLIMMHALPVMCVLIVRYGLIVILVILASSVMLPAKIAIQPRSVLVVTHVILVLVLVTFVKYVFRVRVPLEGNDGLFILSEL